jgi:hypothetical protein
MTARIDVAELLPTVHRLRDIERGGSLAALLALVEREAELVEADVTGLWDDLFVETCADWVIPYIGDLVGNVPLHEAVRGRRADVAKTISYRRRKGILPMLEELARDVTGWGAHVAESMELLGWTQNVNHVRLERAPAPGIAGHVGPPAVGRVGPVHVRDRDATDRLGTAFDTTAHTVDVRRPRETQGWYGIHKVLVFLWRLEAFALDHVTAARVAAGDPARWTFSTLGNPAPLFSRPAPVTDPPGLATELNVPGPIRPLAFHANPSAFYDGTASFEIHGTPVADVLCKDLSSWSPPPGNRVAVDVRLGRIMFGTGKLPAAPPQVSHRYGFAARIGGGPYPRERRRELAPGERHERDAPPDPVEEPRAYGDLVRVLQGGGAGTHPTIESALATSWTPAAIERTVIEVEDSGTYVLPAGGLVIPTTTAAAELVIQARNRARPTLLGSIDVPSTGLARLVLDGLLIAGTLAVAGNLAELELRHCTLVPGVRLLPTGAPEQPATASLTIAQPTRLRRVVIERSILGPIRMTEELGTLELRDSILVAPERPPGQPRVALAANASGSSPGPAATIERSTVVGGVRLRELSLGSDSIFALGALQCDRRQAGCLRFSAYERDGARTPRRYRCQPDAAIEAAGPGADADAIADAVRPRFASLHYGEPAFAQLTVEGPGEIATGASDGAEMGAYAHLRQPQREANLRVRLDEYLPFGLEPGLIHVT